MKIAHWIPTGGNVARWPCVMSWLNMELPAGAERIVIKGGVNNPRFSWNESVRQFLKTGAEWLFSTHDDITFDKGTLKRLLSWNEPLVSALTFMRVPPVVPHIWRRQDGGNIYSLRVMDTLDWFSKRTEYIKFGPFLIDPRPDDALVPVDFTSTSCTLIHRSVIEKMSEVCGDQWFVMDDDINGGGEDRRFFEIAAQVGFTPKVDRSCVVGHIAGDYATSTADFFVWSQASVYHNTGEPGSPEGIL